MIPRVLEMLVMDGAASDCIQFGGGALSTFAIPSNRIAIIWQLEIFPFFDVADAVLTPAEIAARSMHFFEFSDDRERFGIVHRSSYRSANAPPAPPEYSPATTATIYPCYRVFDSKNIVCRIMHMPGNNRGQVTGTAPSQEGAVVAGYEVAVSVPVLHYFLGYGDGLSWQPDGRQSFPGVPVVTQPRPKPDVAPAADKTILELPRTTADEMRPYSFPLVNANIILVERPKWEAAKILIRHQLQNSL